MAAEDGALHVLAQYVKDKQVLGGDDSAVHAHHLSDVSDLAGPVAQARNLNHYVDRGGNHLASSAGGQRETAHGDHRLKARKSFARAVGVQRTQRAVVTGVHSLQHFERLGPAHLADYNAFWAHAQAVAHQIAHGDLPFAFQVGRSRLQAHYVRLLQLQFSGVFAGDNALVIVDELGEAVEQRGFPRTPTARNHRIYSAAPDDAQNLGALRLDGAHPDELIECKLVLLELADGQCGTVDRQRRHDDVYPRTVREACVANRRGFIDAAADLTDDTLANIEELLVVTEAGAGLLDLAFNFDVNGVGTIYHNIGDVVPRQQWLERPETKHVVTDIIEQPFLLGNRHHNVLDRDDLVDDIADFLPGGIGIKLCELSQIDRLDQRVENCAFSFVKAIGALRIDRGRHGVIWLRRGGRYGP